MSAAERIPVEVAPIARGPISSTLVFNSTLETESAVDIYPQTGGQVHTLLVEEGDLVSADQPLLQIDDRELRVDVQQTESNVEHLKRALARLAGLHERELVRRQEYDDAKYQLEQAQLQLERSRLRLSYTTVRAPFAGVVTARDVQVGARVGTGTKLFSMVKRDDLVARVFVPGRYLSVISEGQAAVVTSEFLPGRTFEGWVKRISPVIDPKSGTFKVTVGVRSSTPSDLPPGLFVSARIVTDTHEQALLIPKRALVYEGGERFVFTITNDRAVKRKLSGGFEDPDHVEATSGFEVGASVIVLGQNGLKDGSPVRVVPATPTAPPEPSTATASQPATAGDGTASRSEKG